MVDPEVVELKGKGNTKRKALRSKCPVCGTTLFRIIKGKVKQEDKIDIEKEIDDFDKEYIIK